MRWEDERYVRIFTRDTPSWDAMGWEAQALLMLIFRKMDRTGLLALGSSGMRGLAACVRMPADVVARALQVLLEDGVLSWSGPDLFCKNFLEAQECSKSDSLRSREKRERAQLKLTQSVSPPTQSVSQVTQVDRTCHTVTLGDTPSVPSDPVPSDPKEHMLTLRASKHVRQGSEAFAKFWQAYPRKTGKGQAIKAWPGDDLIEPILAALAWQVPTWRDPQYIKHPATWLRARCWEDERQERPAPTSVLPANRFEIVRAIERQRLGEDRRQPTLGLLDEVNHGNR